MGERLGFNPMRLTFEHNEEIINGHLLYGYSDGVILSHVWCHDNGIWFEGYMTDTYLRNIPIEH